GVNFAVHSSVAESVVLCLFDRAGEGRGSVRLPGRTGDVWHGFVPAPLAAAGDLYAYRVHGPYAPERGPRCNPAKLLIDPCARAVTGEPAHGPSLYDAAGAAALDSAAAMPRGRIVAREFDWGGDRPPGRPWSDTVLYELHVKGFTARHPLVPERLRGTYLGLAEPAVVDWLVQLGVTAVELLPCQAFATEGFLRERGLVNYWGYNPFAWSAPATQYALADPVEEFRRMVQALHAAGIEVILDVVYNHTAEGNGAGPTLSLKGFDNGAYYRLDAAGGYVNHTGCGNTVDASHPATRALIVDSLRWWAEAMHVDGFRFDLAPVIGRDGDAFHRDAPLFAALRADPALAYLKWIAEPWDVGPDGYQLGQFPAGWSEWNDRYRDTVRGFWRGDRYALGALAERMAGSSDIFRHRGRKPSASINYVTSHDGFTLADLVSYNERHNEANLEGNADGHSDNRSWNCGVEGPSAEPRIVALRERQMRNLLATLLLSQGVPMLLAGDEFGRSQRGNNNAYCQDNELGWVDWSLAAARPELGDFVRRLLALRRRRPELRRETFLKGGRRGARGHDVRWLRADGREMREVDWNDPRASAVAIALGGLERPEPTLLVLVNGGAEPVRFTLPAPVPAGGWRIVADSAAPAAAEGAPAAEELTVEARALVALERA
ncbi:MAG: glycogen debranching protein GlgX, partial [Proteobacteria bacterium]|nr:glycogen debranching protein GlgX [Pseudomonadota bacterium]